MSIHVNFIGHLAKDAEPKISKNGQREYLSYTVAVNEFVRGETKTSWMRVTDLSESGRQIKNYLKKGAHIVVYGTETVNPYLDKEGKMQVSRDIMADRVEFVGGGKKNDNANGAQQQAQVPSYANSSSANAPFPPSDFQCGNQLNRAPQQPSAPTYQQQPLPFSPKDSDDDLPF